MAKSFSWLGAEYFNDEPNIGTEDDAAVAVSGNRPTDPVEVPPVVHGGVQPFNELTDVVTAETVSQAQELEHQEEVVENESAVIENDIDDLEKLNEVATESLKVGGMSVTAARIHMSMLTNMQRKYGLELSASGNGLEGFMYSESRIVATEGIIQMTTQAINQMLTFIGRKITASAQACRVYWLKYKADIKKKKAEIQDLKVIIGERTMEDQLPALKMNKALSALCIENEYDLDRCIRYANNSDKLDDIGQAWRGIMTSFTSGRQIFREGVVDELTDTLKPLDAETTKTVRSALSSKIFRAAPFKCYSLPGNIALAVVTDTKTGLSKVDWATYPEAGWPETTIAIRDKAELDSVLQAAEVLANRISVKLDNFEITSNFISHAIKNLKTFTTPDGEVTVEEAKRSEANLESAWNVEVALTNTMLYTLDGLLTLVKSNLSFMQ